MTARTARVLIASTRAAAGQYQDRCGPIIVDWLSRSGFSVPAPVVVADGTAVGEALRAAIAPKLPTCHHLRRYRYLAHRRHAGADRGGARLRDSRARRRDPALGSAEGADAVLSRGVCGVAGRTLVSTCPAHRGVRDGLAVLADVLDHALDQLPAGTTRGDAGPACGASPNGPSIWPSIEALVADHSRRRRGRLRRGDSRS